MPQREWPRGQEEAWSTEVPEERGTGKAKEVVTSAASDAPGGGHEEE
jgi:hypothetical protein